MRLRRLTTVLEPTTQNLSHGHELCALPQFKEIVAALASADAELPLVLEYAFGNSWVLGCAAVDALKVRADGSLAAPRVAERFDSMSAWQMQFALEYLAGAEPKVLAGAPLAGFAPWWSDNGLLPHVFADYFTALAGSHAAIDVGEHVRGLPEATQGQIKAFLGRVRHPMAVELAAQLADGPPAGAAATDPGFLAALGRFWSDDTEAEPLTAPPVWREALADAEAILIRKPLRSLLVNGEPLVGKSSFLRLVAERHAKDGWRVFEASGADLKAGQKYIGQLEGRIRQALEELAVSKKIIWYIPDLLDLALSGTHQGQSASILDQIMPAITAGRLMVWAEATPASAARLLQMRPKLRRLLDVVRLEPMDEDETKALAEGVITRLAKDKGVDIDGSTATAAIDAAQDYLNAASLPGSALALIKLTVLRTEKASTKRIGGPDILETLAQMTGLPLSILDGQERIELDKIRAFFSTRVIGQSEAVESVVDRIAMLKSGLNDPGKPIGVFLFAGPTGTGKTELAKTIAEYLFGSEERMIRLDMSEYQSPDSSG